MVKVYQFQDLKKIPREKQSVKIKSLNFAENLFFKNKIKLLMLIIAFFKNYDCSISKFKTIYRSFHSETSKWTKNWLENFLIYNSETIFYEVDVWGLSFTESFCKKMSDFRFHLMHQTFFATLFSMNYFLGLEFWTK